MATHRMNTRLSQNFWAGNTPKIPILLTFEGLRVICERKFPHTTRLFMLMPTVPQVARLVALSLNPPDLASECHHLLTWLEVEPSQTTHRVGLIQKYHAKFHGKRVKCTRRGLVCSGTVRYIYVRDRNPYLTPDEQHRLIDAKIRFEDGSTGPASCDALEILDETQPSTRM